MAIIGIDLGTTNSLCVTYKDGRPCLIPNAFGQYLTPSVVHICDGKVFVGKVAKDKLVTDPEHTVHLFKRAMGTQQTYKIDRKKYTPEMLSSYVVKQLIEDAKEYLHEDIEEVVISVPAYFNAKQRRATKEIGKILGVKLERLINEPSAAAIACHQADAYETFVVFDFGGGTLDVSVVDCFENVISINAICGNNFIGGSDFDRAIAMAFCCEVNIRMDALTKQEHASLLLAAERVKIAIGKQETALLKMHIKNQMYTYTFNREQIRSICMPILEKTKSVIAKAVKDSGFHANELDSVIPVGGSSQMPIVQEYLANLLSVPVDISEELKYLVALGLGKYIGIKQRKEEVKDVVVTDICPFSLCTEVINHSEPDKLLSRVLIPRNTVLPTSKTIALQTSYLGQKVLDLSVYQGESLYTKDNLLLGKAEIPIPCNEKEKELFELTYSYDINSMLYIELLICSTNQKFVYQIGENNTLISIEDVSNIQKIKQVSDVLNRQSEYDAVLERMNRVYMEQEEVIRERLEVAMHDFIQQYRLSGNNIKKRLLLIDDFNRYLDFFDQKEDEMDIFYQDEEEELILS